MNVAHTEMVGKYRINLELLPEDTAPDWDFGSDTERLELLERIDRGEVLWFCAKVSAVLDGVCLAEIYVGGCCYYSVADFIRPGDQYSVMVSEVVAEADEWLKRNAP